jgi:hypothetical protein
LRECGRVKKNGLKILWKVKKVVGAMEVLIAFVEQWVEMKG